MRCTPALPFGTAEDCNELTTPARTPTQQTFTRPPHFGALPMSGVHLEPAISAAAVLVLE